MREVGKESEGCEEYDEANNLKVGVSRNEEDDESEEGSCNADGDPCRD